MSGKSVKQAGVYSLAVIAAAGEAVWQECEDFCWHFAFPAFFLLGQNDCKTENKMIVCQKVFSFFN